MVLKITVTESGLLVDAIIHNNLLGYLIDLIGGKLNSIQECSATSIRLPVSISKEHRYKIHRYSCAGFVSKSEDLPNGDRIMTVFLTKDYVCNLLKDYDWNTCPVVPATPAIPVLTEKQVIFNNLMEFINKNFSEEFTKYLESI
jgi:hypothetical protein